jgi:hypothetical protein
MGLLFSTRYIGLVISITRLTMMGGLIIAMIASIYVSAMKELLKDTT